MRIQAIRRSLKAAIGVDAVLVTWAILDYAVFESAAMPAVLSLFILLLAGVVVLVVIDASPRYRRVVFDVPKEEPHTIIYGRRNG